MERIHLNQNQHSGGEEVDDDDESIYKPDMEDLEPELERYLGS